MGPLALPAISIAAGLVGGAVNAFTAKKNTDLQNKANKELAEYQYSKDLEMWNKGNAYNDPTAQMQRLKRAGLNPNLVYGQGAVGNTTGQLPKYNAPTMSYNYRPPVDPLQMLGAYQDFRLRQAEIKKSENEASYSGLMASEKYNELLNRVKEGGARADIQKIIMEMMAGTYSSNTVNGKPSATPTDWQKYTMEGMRLRNRVSEEQALNIATQAGKTNIEGKLRGLDLDMYLKNWWTKLIFGGMRAIK